MAFLYRALSKESAQLVVERPELPCGLQQGFKRQQLGVRVMECMIS